MFKFRFIERACARRQCVHSAAVVVTSLTRSVTLHLQIPVYRSVSHNTCHPERSETESKDPLLRWGFFVASSSE